MTRGCRLKSVGILFPFKHISSGRGGGRKLGIITKDINIAAPIAIGATNISFLPSLFFGFSSLILRLGNYLTLEEIYGVNIALYLCVKELWNEVYSLAK
jgi:hypothetical protein